MSTKAALNPIQLEEEIRERQSEKPAKDAVDSTRDEDEVANIYKMSNDPQITTQTHLSHPEELDQHGKLNGEVDVGRQETMTESSTQQEAEQVRIEKQTYMFSFVGRTIFY